METCAIPVWPGMHRERCGLDLTEGGECPRHGLAGGGFARALTEDYFIRSGAPGATSLDAVYQIEHGLLRDMLTRLELILDDEGVDLGTAMRVIRCMLYGSPTQSAAEARMQMDAQIRELARFQPPPIHVTVDDSAKLRLPPL